MENNNYYDSELVNSFILTRNYSGVYNYFVQEEIPFTTFLIFLKREINIWKDETFWQSELSTFKTKELLESDIRLKFLNTYFSNGKFCNHKLNRLVHQQLPETFIHFLKFTKAYSFSSFRHSLTDMARNSVDLSVLAIELSVIEKKEDQLRIEERNGHHLLLQIPIDKVFFAFTLFLQEYKCDQTRLPNNKSEEIMTEMAIVTSLNNFLKFYVASPLIKPIPFYKTNKELNEDWVKFAPYNPFVKKEYKLSITDFDFLIVKDFIKRDTDRQDARGKIDLYLSGYFEFTDVTTKPLQLESNNRYIIYKKNDRKSGYREKPFAPIPFRTVACKCKNIITYN